MQMNDISGNVTAEKRAFSRWTQKANPEMRSALNAAVELMLPMLISEGFSWKERDYSGHKVPPNEIYLCRSVDSNVFHYVIFQFDKNQAPLFVVYFAERQKLAPEYKFIKSGDLVRVQSDEYFKAKLWGARWWSLRKRKIFKRATHRVQLLLPHVINFLEHGTPHENIWINPV